MSQAALLIRGQVVDARGRPVAGARLMWHSAPVDLPDVAALSGADGGFVLAVPVTGRYRLACQSDTHGQAMADITVAADGAQLTMRLPR